MIDELKLETLCQNAKRIRLIAADLDGTLLDSKHTLSAENRNALETLAGKGIVVAMATGRSRSSIPDSLTDIKGLKYLITANGSRIFNNETNELLCERFLSAEALDYVRPFLDDPEVMCVFFWSGVPYVEQSKYDNAAEYGVPRWYSDYFYNSRRPLSDFETAVNNNAHIIENITFCFNNDEIKNRVLTYLKKRPDLYEIAASFSFNYEIGGVGVRKDTAIDMIAKREGILQEETIAFGDNDNDISMIRYAGIGVAVANATPGAIEAADLVSEQDNNNSGVADALKLLGMV